MGEKNTRFKRVDYSWVIIALSFLMVMVCLGLCSSGRTLYLTAITDALGFSRGAYALTDTFRFVTTTILNLYFGKLVYRFGTKKLMCLGFLCLMGFAFISSFATNIFAFYGASILLGIGLSWTSTTMVSTIINKWCTKNKGTITGATLAANGIGGAIAIQILSPLIFEEGNKFGYQTSYRVVAVVLAITLFLVLILYRENPKGSEEIKTVVKGKKHKVRGAGWIGMEYSEAIKKPYFYIAIFCMFLTGMSLQGLGGIAVPHMYDVGLDVEYVALLASLGGIILTLAKITNGFMYDRVGMRITMNICFVCSLISIFALVILSNTQVGKIIAFIRYVLSSFALPLETVMLPLFASEFFGNKAFDKCVGVFAAASTAGFAIGSPFGNVLFDIFGSYNVAFVVLGIMMIIVSILMQIVLTNANRDKKEILALQETNKLEVAQRE